MGLALVLLLNSILMIRPAEFVPGLAGIPLYEIVLALSLLVCAPQLLAELSPARLAATPIVGCLFVFLTVSIVSNLVRADLDILANTLTDALRITLYVTLTFIVLDTPRRLRLFLFFCVLNATIVTGLAILNYRGFFTIPGFLVIQEGETRRLGASGLFGDPNDLALLITQAMILCSYSLIGRSMPSTLRAVNLAMMLVLGYGLQLTHSRGGLLGLLVGVGVVLLNRYRGKGLLLAGVTLPLVLVVFAGRQADFGGAVNSGSGQSRIHLWDEYLALALQNPVLGIGAGAWRNHAHQVAHNSFLHAFAETGMFGGVAFLAMNWLAVLILLAFGPRRTEILDPEMERLRPYLLAMVCGYLMGMLSLTRVYTIPTYTMLATVIVYSRVTAADPPPSTLRLDARFWSRAWGLSFVFLALLWLYVKKNASYY